MTKHILLALQPESTSDLLLAQAASWATRLGMKLDLCSALPVRVSADPLHTQQSVVEAATAAVEAQRRIGEWLEDCVASLPESIRGESQVLLGEAVSAVHEAAGSADMLAIGSHHRRDVSRILLGSVSEKLVQTATVPVLVLPTADAPASTDPLRVHLPLDPAEPDFRAISWVREHLPEAHLTVVYRLSWMKTFAPLQPDADTIMAQAHERLQTALTQGGHGDLTGLIVVREESNIGDALAAEAHTSQADLVAMPTHGRTGFAHLFLGSVSERVVRAADCAVLVVH